MELRQLHTFVKCAELLHFTKAANALHVSQSALSAQIHQLEEELGTSLFDRSSRHVHLTATGEVFLENARKALQELEAGQIRIQSLATGELCGNFRLSVTSHYCGSLIPRILAKFTRLYPAVHIEVRTLRNKAVCEAVSAGEVDLGAVCLPSGSTLDGLISNGNSCALFEEEIVAVVPRTHYLARSRGLCVGDLKNVQLVLPTLEFNSRQLVDAVFAAEKIEPRVLLESDNVFLLLALVKLGAGVTILPSQAAAHIPSKDVVRVRFFDKGLRLTAAFIWPPRREISAVAKRVVDLAIPLCAKLSRRRS